MSLIVLPNGVGPCKPIVAKPIPTPSGPRPGGAT